MNNRDIKNNKFETALTAWIYRAQEIVGKRAELTLRKGRKYIKVLEDSGSAFCFIDMNGNVLKADSWTKPAPQPRGNIWKVGEEGIDKYGAHYLR